MVLEEWVEEKVWMGTVGYIPMDGEKEWMEGVTLCVTQMVVLENMPERHHNSCWKD